MDARESTSTPSHFLGFSCACARVPVCAHARTHVETPFPFLILQRHLEVMEQNALLYMISTLFIPEETS